MGKYFTVIIVLLALFCSIGYAAETEKPKQAWTVNGTWIAGPNSGADFGWYQSGKTLKFLISGQLTAYPYKVTLKEPLPKGDYTIDIWFESTSINTLSFCIGDPKTNHNRPVFSQQHHPRNGFPLKWVRLSCSPSQGLVAISNNQGSCIRNASDVGSDLTGQFSLVIQSGSWNASASEALRVLSFSVTSGLGPEFGATGPAYKGWDTKIKPGSIENFSAVAPQIEAVYDSAKTDAGKGYALASIILAEYAAKGSIEEKTWSKLSGFVEELLPRERSGLAIVLPIAATCSNEKQKAQIKVWTKQFFNIQMYDQWQAMKINSDTQQKVILLDPISSTRMSQNISHCTVDYWTQALKQCAPQFASLPVMYVLNDERWKSEAVAWMLPDIYTASPELGKSAVDVIKQFAKDPNQQPGEPDRTLSFAAYRLAVTEPAMSSVFLEMIKDPEIKADTIYYINQSISDTVLLDTKAIEAVESLMRQAIVQWKPTKLHPSPVESMMRLVRFLDSHKQPTKAQEMLTEAIAAIDLSSRDAQRDIVDVARYKMQVKSDDHQEWWDKAISTAVAADEAYGMPDNSEGIYISSLTLMAWDLVKLGKLDEALELVKKMDPELMVNNRAMSLDRIIVKTLKSSVDDALSLLSLYPDMRAKNGITGVIAAKMAADNLKGALDLVNSIPASSRTTALLRIASVVPANKLPEIMGQLKPAVAAGVKPGGSFEWLFSNDSVGRYADLPLGTLLSLSEAFEKSPDLLAVYLLANIVKHCGLETDPIWLHYWGINRTSGDNASIPWGTSKLRFAVTAK